MHFFFVRESQFWSWWWRQSLNSFPMSSKLKDQKMKGCELSSVFLSDGSMYTYNPPRPLTTRIFKMRTVYVTFNLRITYQHSAQLYDVTVELKWVFYMTFCVYFNWHQIFMYHAFNKSE